MGKLSLKRRSLRSQFVLVTFCVIFFITALSCSVMFMLFFRQVHQAAVDAMLEKSYSSQLYATRYLSQKGDIDNTTYLKKIAPYFASHMSDATGLEVEIYSTEGILANSSGRHNPELISNDIAAGFQNKSFLFFASKAGVILSFSSPIYGAEGETAGVIRYIYPMNTQYKQLRNIAILYGGLTIAALSLTLIICFIFAREITKPLYLLVDKVNSMKEGNLQQRILPVGNAEMDDLGSAFNMMCERLDEYITIMGNQQQQLQQFFNNTTHQLKTPLTSIIGYSQMIQLNSDNDQVCEDAFIIEEAGETLLRSIETVLEESRSQTLWHPLQTTTFGLFDMVKESTNLLKPRLKKCFIQVENTIPETFTLHTDRSILQEVILVLLDNAILHSGCNKIQIWYSQNGEDPPALHIKDNGRGIPLEDVPYIFKAFYRSTNSGESGNGLGLSVCESFMRRLGTSIQLIQKEGEGAEYVLYLPK